jgi:hypothetical protein
MDNPNKNIAFIITTTNNAQLQLITNVGLMVNTINNKQQIICNNSIWLIIITTKNDQPQPSVRWIDHQNNQHQTTYENILLIINAINVGLIIKTTKNRRLTKMFHCWPMQTKTIIGQPTITLDWSSLQPTTLNYN